MDLISRINLFLLPQEYQQVQALIQNINKRVHKGTEEVSKSLKKLLRCFQNTERDRFYFHTHVRNALSEVLIAFTTPLKADEQSAISKIEKSLSYIEEHLTEPIRVTDLPPMDHMSLSTYNKYFLQVIGLPPGEYILKKKIDKVKVLLETTNFSITEIAYRYGFSSSQYFTTVFKRFCHVSPTEFRKNKSIELYEKDVKENLEKGLLLKEDMEECIQDAVKKVSEDGLV